jgi:hypothetical protein
MAVRENRNAGLLPRAWLGTHRKHLFLFKLTRKLHKTHLLMAVRENKNAGQSMKGRQKRK